MKRKPGNGEGFLEGNEEKNSKKNLGFDQVGGETIGKKIGGPSGQEHALLFSRF